MNEACLCFKYRSYSVALPSMDGRCHAWVSSVSVFYRLKSSVWRFDALQRGEGRGREEGRCSWLSHEYRVHEMGKRGRRVENL
uniref:Uncharacterized protein n=1 Tax=Ascaris lumbricoides TaxID=6252 RepID=A0A0M3IQX2_ASCLU